MQDPTVMRISLHKDPMYMLYIKDPKLEYMQDPTVIVFLSAKRKKICSHECLAYMSAYTKIQCTCSNQKIQSWESCKIQPSLFFCRPRRRSQLRARPFSFVSPNVPRSPPPHRCSHHPKSFLFFSAATIKDPMPIQCD